MEHDQRFKVLLREFLPEFLTLFFPKQAAWLDLSAVGWLEKEMFANPPDGDVFEADLVARLPLREGGEDAFALVHTEIESADAMAGLRRRMFRYYSLLRDTHPTARIFPIAVFLRAAGDGIGESEVIDRFGDDEVMRFRFWYVGLPGLSAERYVAGDSWLGVALASLMAVNADRRAWLRAEALRRLTAECTENKHRRLLLFDCVEAYLNLDDSERGAFGRLLEQERYAMIKTFGLSSWDKGILAGRAEWLPRVREYVRDTLLLRFKMVPENLEADLTSETDPDNLDCWLRAAHTTPDLASLRATFERLSQQNRPKRDLYPRLTPLIAERIVEQAQMLPSLRDAFLRLVRVRFGSVPADVQAAVGEIGGLALEGWSEAAEKATDLAAFRAAVGLPEPPTG